MKHLVLKKTLPHLVVLFFFVVIAFVYSMPVLNGKRLVAHDTVSWRCMAQETIAYNEAHDDVTLWTNAMFGGMPNYQISMKQPNNVLKYVENLIETFPRPVSNLILYLICFYILLLSFELRPWLAAVGAIGLAFASYNLIIIAAGHNSKAITIAYIAPLVGAVFLAFNKNRWLGTLLTTLFLSLAIRANHIQILYYTLLLLLGFVVVWFIYAVKEKKIKSFLQTSGLLLLALALSLGMNATSLLTTTEYSQHTMRGASNGLTVDKNSLQEGLNKDYITQWSYGVGETMTLLIPNFKGGASGGLLDENSETARKLKEFGVPNLKAVMGEMSLPLYWGTQPFTSGPVYVGAIIVLLFVFSFFIVQRRIRWWILPVILLTLMLSWGRNFMPLTDFFITYIPLYNKFRTVSMTLVITCLGIALLAFLALKEIFQANHPKEKLLRSLYWSTSITAGVLLLFWLFPSLAGNFVSTQDVHLVGDYAFLQTTLPLDRKELLRSDALRSLLFVLLSAGVLFFYLKDRCKQPIAIGLLAVLMLFDLLPIDKRYLNDNNFEVQRPKQLIKPSLADEYILKDKSNYRVLDATVNIFNDAKPSYFHKNIGGYHAAKLRRYQELINMQLDAQINVLLQGLGQAKSQDDTMLLLANSNILNMLNMKYLIYSPEAQPIENPFANDNVWLVGKINIAKDANDEMMMLKTLDTKNELVVDKTMASILPSVIQTDSAAQIKLTSYAPNHLKYHFSGATQQVAVFSEIYYEDGWKAFINGKEVPYTRVNYLLRAMPLEAGTYDIEFVFVPTSYQLGNTLSLWSSVLFLLAVVGYVLGLIKNKKKIKKNTSD